MGRARPLRWSSVPSATVGRNDATQTERLVIASLPGRPHLKLDIGSTKHALSPALPTTAHTSPPWQGSVSEHLARQDAPASPRRKHAPSVPQSVSLEHAREQIPVTPCSLAATWTHFRPGQSLPSSQALSNLGRTFGASSTPHPAATVRNHTAPVSPRNPTLPAKPASASLCGNLSSGRQPCTGPGGISCSVDGSRGCRLAVPLLVLREADTPCSRALGRCCPWIRRSRASPDRSGLCGSGRGVC